MAWHSAYHSALERLMVLCSIGYCNRCRRSYEAVFYWYSLHVTRREGWQARSRGSNQNVL